MTPLFTYPARPRIAMFQSRIGARIRIQGWFYHRHGRQPHGTLREGHLTRAAGRNIWLDDEPHYLPNIARAWVLDEGGSLSTVATPTGYPLSP